MDLNLSPPSEMKVLLCKYESPGIYFLALYCEAVYMNVRRYWGKWPESFMETSIMRPWGAIVQQVTPQLFISIFVQTSAGTPNTRQAK